MDERTIHSVLQEALEGEIPASEINLWPDVKAKLVTGTALTRKPGVKMNSIRRPRRQPIALAVLIILIL